MSTLTNARKAIAEKIAATVPREANVRHYECADEPTEYPRISIEIPQIDYFQTIGNACSRAEVSGRIVVEVAALTDEDAATVLDDYLDPYSTESVVSAVMAGALETPPFGGAMQSFQVTSSTRVGPGVAEIPFTFSVTRPAP